MSGSPQPGGGAEDAGPLRLLLSAAAKASLEARIVSVLREQPHELVTFESGREDAHAAFVSRDVTGFSTKHAVTEATRRCHDLLRRSPRLAWVHAHSAGLDRPIYTELLARGVAVSSSSGANAGVVAQSAVAGLLALARHLPQLIAAQRERRWAPLIHDAMPRELEGQTALIVGWGPVGQRIGACLQALGLRLMVARHTDRPAGPGIDTFTFGNWRKALAHADWLVLATPLSDVTRGMVDGAALARLPEGARVVNVGRGEVVVERELIDALRSGRVAAAFLDVFENEPLEADSPLWTLPNVIATPHSAGHSDGNAARVEDMFLDNLGRYAAGLPLLNAGR